MTIALHLWTVDHLLVGVSTALPPTRRDELRALLGEGPGLDAVLDLLTADGLANTAPFLLAAAEADGVRLVIRGELHVTVGLADGTRHDQGPGRSATWRDDVVADVVDLAVPTDADGGALVWLVPEVPTEPEPEPAAGPAAEVVPEPVGPEPDPVEVVDVEPEPVPEPGEPDPALGGPEPAAEAPTPDYSGLLGRTVYERVGSSSPAAAGASTYDPVGGGPTLTESDPGAAAVLTEVDGSEAATQPWAPPTPGPGQVQAVRCPAGHPNPPTAVVCRSCGVPIVDPTISIVARPVVARLRFDDGAVIDVDRTQIIGRGPTAPSGLVEAPNLIALPNPDGDLSREHTTLRLEGWDVVVEDLGSTNGTEVHLPGREPQRLHDHDPILVVPGTRVTLAGVVGFTVEAPADAGAGPGAP